MFFSALSRVSSFEVDDDTVWLPLGERKTPWTVCFVVPYRHS